MTGFSRRVLPLLVLAMSVATPGWAEPPPTGAPLTRAELRQAELVCARLVGAPLKSLDCPRGVGRNLRLAPLLPFLADRRVARNELFPFTVCSAACHFSLALRDGIEVEWLADNSLNWERPVPVERQLISSVTFRRGQKTIFVAAQ